LLAFLSMLPDSPDLKLGVARRQTTVQLFSVFPALRLSKAQFRSVTADSGFI